MTLKKLKLTTYGLSIFVCFFVAEINFVSPAKRVNEFVFKRGTNISHWLSQSNRRGDDRKNYFTEKDVIYLAGLGFDHIRIPVDEEQLWKENGQKERPKHFHF